MTKGPHAVLNATRPWPQAKIKSVCACGWQFKEHKKESSLENAPQKRINWKHSIYEEIKSHLPGEIRRAQWFLWRRVIKCGISAAGSLRKPPSILITDCKMSEIVDTELLVNCTILAVRRFELNSIVNTTLLGSLNRTEVVSLLSSIIDNRDNLESINEAKWVGRKYCVLLFSLPGTSTPRSRASFIYFHRDLLAAPAQSYAN